MKRKDFLRNLLFGVAAVLVPKVLLPHDPSNKLNWEPLPIVPMKLNSAIAAKRKLHMALIISPPVGKIIDLTYLRASLNKNK